MEWGRNHEGNMLLSCLEGPAKDLPMFKGYSIQVQECSFIPVDVSKLPSSIINGISHLLSLLPPMGASPDGMLSCSSRDGSGRTMQIPIECKAACPFHVETGPSEGAWKYEPLFGAWGPGRVPTPYYAQCQMTLLATGCSKMVLMQYLPRTTTIYLVERDDAWARVVLMHLIGINTTVLRPKSPEGLSALLAMQGGAQIFQALLRLTKEGAGRDSVNNGVDSQPFLD
jgi:hypothetical protein